MGMKLLITLLCFGAALARIEEWNWLNSVSRDRKIEDQAFRPGRQYQFFYNGQLTTGIPGASKQHSVNRIQALATISIKSHNNVILQLQNVRVGKMNRQIPNPRKIMPFDAFEDQQIDQHLKQKLEAPVRFSYTNGMVRDVEFDGKEEPWSANVKRGVLNLLQVNLQQHRRIDSPEESILTNARRGDRSGEQDSQRPTFYRVMEETLEGECETLYTIQQQPSSRHSNQPVLNVTKSINFEKCNKRPQVKYNFRFASKCPTCDPKYDQDEKYLKSSTVVQYNITGNKENFLIEMARTESQYVFTPFSEEANVIVTYVNQTLVLVKTGPIQQAQEPQNPIRSDSNMVFTLDWNIAHEKFSMHGSNAGEQTRRILHSGNQGVNKVEMVKKLIQKMTSQMREQVDEEVPRKFSELTEWLRQCDHQELEQIVRLQEQGQASPEEEKKAKNLIPQALGACGTKDCVKQLTQKIQEGRIGPLRGALALKALLHNRVASKDIIQDLMQLAESSQARQHETLKRSAWLAAGSLINALCAENEDQLALEQKEDPRKLCGREQKETYVKTLFEKLRQANKWQDKVLMLKTIGNAGLDLSIFELEKIIRQQDSTQQPLYARLEAILALRELTDDMPKKIQRVLMPVAMNRREYPTIRSMASYMLLKTQPERPLLDQLARSLINEPSHQYAAFLYTQLEQYANSTNPCEEKIATDAKLALRQAKKVSTGLGYSGISHWTFHNEAKKVGLDADFGAIYSNTSYIPRHIGGALHSNRFGYWQKYLATLSLFSEGLEPLIREFSTQRGPLSNALADILRRHPRNVQNGDNEFERELDDIFSRHLKIRHRQYEHEYENDPKAYFTAMIKSQTVAVLPLGKELLQQALQDAPAKIGELTQKLQRGVAVDYSTAVLLNDVHLKIPTTLGLPLAINLDAPMAISVKGKIQASFDGSKKAKAEIELKPSVVATVKCEVEAWSPIVVSGVKVQSKAKFFTPIDAKVEVEWGQNPQIKANIKPPTQKRDILILESRPITFTQSWQDYLRSADKQSSTDEQTVVGEELNRVNTFNKCAGRQTLGFDVCARGQVQNTPEKSPKGTPFAPLSGQNKIVVTCQPSESNQDIQIKINSRIQKVNGQEMHKPSFSNLGRQEPFEADYDGSSSESSSEPTSGQDSQQSSAERREQHRRSPQHQQRHPPQGRQPQRNTFQQYRDYQIKRGYKTQVDIEYQAPNSRATVELSHVYDAQQRYGKVNMKVHRQQPDQWQACLDAEMMFPERPQFVDQVRDKKVLGQAQLRWGQSCSSQNYIQVTTQAERSRQQVQWERDMSEYKQYSSKQQCQNNKGWCSPLTQEDFVEKIGHMLKYRVDIDYQNVPPSVKNATNKLYRALKYYYFWQTDINQINVQNQEGKIKAELVLDAQTKQRLNVTIKTPKENIMIQDLPLAKPVMTLNQKQSFADQARNYWDDEDEDEDQAQCSVTGKTGLQRRSQVETFDGTKFSAPFSNCWVVLAKDCGSPKPEFMVMARKSQQPGANGEQKEVKILTRQNRIELKPDNAEYDSVKVKVNGQQYDPESDPDVEANEHVVAKIEKEGQAISVELPRAGAEVEFDGYAINIKLNQFYQGQQCGLCGHFDGEEADEFRNPDFTEEQDLRQFYMNYLIKDGQCQAPKQLQEICEDEDCDQDRSSSSSSSSSSSDEDDNDNDETTEKPDRKTKVIEIDDRICFSTIPVPQCDDNSYPVSIKEQKQVPYTCIDQDSSSAESLERKARYNKNHVPNLANRQPNFTRTESIPEKCKKYKS